MIGLFEENGPCHFVNGESTPSLNEHSWNNDVNMIYIDQPIGVGFSYGDDKVTSTETAAPYVWKLLQAFYAQFPQYENRDFGLFTEVGHNNPLTYSIITGCCHQSKKLMSTSLTAGTTDLSSHLTSKNKTTLSSLAQSQGNISTS